MNDCLREISNQDFTAKDFRTWAGTVLACVALGECAAFDSESQAKKNVVRAIESVAERLGNTPSVPQMLCASRGAGELPEWRNEKHSENEQAMQTCALGACSTARGSHANPPSPTKTSQVALHRTAALPRPRLLLAKTEGYDEDRNGLERFHRRRARKIATHNLQSGFWRDALWCLERSILQLRTALIRQGGVAFSGKSRHRRNKFSSLQNRARTGPICFMGRK